MNNLVQLRTTKNIGSELVNEPIDGYDPETLIPLEISFVSKHFGKTLRCLCIPFAHLTDTEMFIISESFPQLTHLDVRQNLHEREELGLEGITEKGYRSLTALQTLESLHVGLRFDYWDETLVSLFFIFIFSY
jgi:hypothetical protein